MITYKFSICQKWITEILCTNEMASGDNIIKTNIELHCVFNISFSLADFDLSPRQVHDLRASTHTTNWILVKKNTALRNLVWSHEFVKWAIACQQLLVTARNNNFFIYFLLLIWLDNNVLPYSFVIIMIFECEKFKVQNCMIMMKNFKINPSYFFLQIGKIKIFARNKKCKKN